MVNKNLVHSSQVYLKGFGFVVIWLSFSWLVGNKDLNTWLDVVTYNNYFLKAADITSLSSYFQNAYYDPLFLLIVKPFTFFSNGFALLLFFLASISLLIKLLVFYRITDHFVILLLMYASYLLFLHDYVQIRIALSLSLILLSMYLVKNKKIQFVLLCLAFLIHASAIIVIFFWILVQRLSNKYLLVFCLIMIFSSPLLVTFFSFIPKVNIYIQILSEGRFNKINLFSSMILIQLMTMIYLSIFYNKMKMNENIMEYKLSWIGVTLFYSFSQIPVFAHRFYELFIVFFIILLSKIYRKSYFIMMIIILLMLSGIKSSFYGDEPLISF